MVSFVLKELSCAGVVAVVVVLHFFKIRETKGRKSESEKCVYFPNFKHIYLFTQEMNTECASHHITRLLYIFKLWQTNVTKKFLKSKSLLEVLI